jgi:hypothetical protein
MRSCRWLSFYLARGMTENNSWAVWEQVIAMPVFAISLTLGSYQLGRLLQRLCRGNPIVNPVLISILFIGGAEMRIPTTFSGLDSAQPIPGGKSG